MGWDGELWECTVGRGWKYAGCMRVLGVCDGNVSLAGGKVGRQEAGGRFDNGLDWAGLDWIGLDYDGV